MKGRRHNLVVLEPLGTYTRDAEGRSTPDYRQHNTKGHITVPSDSVRLDYAEQIGEVVDAEALIDKSIPITGESLVAAIGTGITLLDGTYRVIGLSPNQWHTRVMLRKYEVSDGG